MTMDKSENHITSNEKVIKERKEKIANFFKKSNWVVWLTVLLLIIILIVNINIRTGNIDRLKDESTGNLTLAPDLDPFLFLRWANYIVDNGRLMENDTMRYFPAGYNTALETRILPYSIAYIYKFLHVFNSETSVEYAAIIYPVIFFTLGVIAFFLFVRRVFRKYGDNKNWIALISTAFLIVMQPLLHRTLAGIPEKEPMGFFFMFLTFYLFSLAMQTDSKKMAIVYGALAGLSTGMLGLVWGGLTFVFLGIASSTLIFFFIRHFEEKDYFVYSSWLIAFTIILSFFTIRYGGVFGLLTSTTSAISYFVFIVLTVNFILEKKFSEKIKSKTILSFVITLSLAIIFMVLFNREMIIHAFNDIRIGLLHPLGIDRITLTVAENNQPYFPTWQGTFGLGFFWIFFAASVLLFYEAIIELKKSEKIFLTLVYVLFLIGVIFSRYKGTSIMNGTSVLSQFVFFGSFVVFILSFAFIYFIAQKNNESEKFKRINRDAIFVVVLFFWAVVSARGAVRNFFILAPIVSILVGFLAVDLPVRAKKSKEDLMRILLIIVSIIMILLLLQTFYSYYNSAKYEGKYTIPSAYNVQWQNAMSWVRDSTPKDAVFAHWWDYGYWVQTLGERATVLDGGNKMGYWNHLMGRYVLTGQNETEALEFLKTHSVSYLLIDSTEVGKYSAYSSIGSDKNYDRYSWINTFLIDDRQTTETRNETLFVYTGGTVLDEPFTWYDAAKKEQIYLPAQSNTAVIAGFVLSFDEKNVIKQPRAVVFYKDQRIDIPVKCVYHKGEGKKYEFSDPALPGCLYLFPKIDQASGGQQISINEKGAALWLSNKAVNALWVKLYLFNESTNFKLAHSEENYIVKTLNSQGTNLPETVFFGDFQGPIKIWEINYPSNIKINEEYLSTFYPEEIYVSR